MTTRVEKEENTGGKTLETETGRVRGGKGGEWKEARRFRDRNFNI